MTVLASIKSNKQKTLKVHGIHLSRDMRKLDFCYEKTKGADPLPSKGEADQHLC